MVSPTFDRGYRVKTINMQDKVVLMVDQNGELLFDAQEFLILFDEFEEIQDEWDYPLNDDIHD